MGAESGLKSNFRSGSSANDKQKAQRRHEPRAMLIKPQINDVELANRPERRGSLIDIESDDKLQNKWWCATD
jgi:hypothetical protein